MNDPTPADATAPVIIVGAGRSGTTRLAATLGAHRDLHMIGETSFLLSRLWTAFFERPAYVRNWRLGQLAQRTLPEWRDAPWWEFWTSEGVQRDLSRLGPVLTDIEASETTRLQQALGRFFVDALVPPALRKAQWGFKEIWAGSSSQPTDWDLYRGAFPRARYVHSVRHPLDYVRSVVAHNQRHVSSDDDLADYLTEWVAMVRHTRLLADTGRYVEFRMEDLERELDRILDALDLPPAPECAHAARLTYLPSQPMSLPVSANVIDRVDGLRTLATELGYPLPQQPSRRTSPDVYSRRVVGRRGARAARSRATL
jgi:hypothetical protein